VSRMLRCLRAGSQAAPFSLLPSPPDIEPAPAQGPSCACRAALLSPCRPQECRERVNVQRATMRESWPDSYCVRDTRTKRSGEGGEGGAVGSTFNFFGASSSMRAFAALLFRLCGLEARPQLPVLLPQLPVLLPAARLGQMAVLQGTDVATCAESCA
jgi:hypothetical protein